MAVGKTVFEIAALDAEKAPKPVDENVAEVRIGPGLYTVWRRPSAAQFTMMQVRFARGGDQQYSGLDKFMAQLLLDEAEVVANDRVDDEGVLYSDRVKSGDRFVGVDFLWEKFEQEVLDEEDFVGILKAAIEVHTGFPTESASSSSPGPTRNGTTSTAASRRNTSRRSTSQ